MKKYILLSSLLFLLSSFAAVDTDSDGVSDEKDVCPRVYSRSENGCPTLTKAVAISDVNACYKKQVNKNMIIRIQPICDATTKICPTLSGVSGIQTCDPIFPVILKDGKPFVRGSIFIVGY